VKEQQMCKGFTFTDFMKMQALPLAVW